MTRGPYLTPGKIERRMMKAITLVGAGIPKGKALRLARIPSRTYYRRIEQAMKSDFGIAMGHRITPG